MGAPGKHCDTAADSCGCVEYLSPPSRSSSQNTIGFDVAFIEIKLCTLKVQVASVLQHSCLLLHRSGCSK
jgi:hypothetical protein